MGRHNTMTVLAAAGCVAAIAVAFRQWWPHGYSAGHLTTRIQARRNVSGRTSLTGRHKSPPARRCC
jgi:hypothetical protein